MLDPHNVNLGARESGASVLRIDALADPRWSDLVEQRGAGLFHSREWLGALVDTYGFRPEARVLVDGHGKPLGGLPFCQIADLFGERLVSLPFSDYCDPAIASPQHWQLLFDAVVALGLPAKFAWRDELPIAEDSRLESVGRARWQGIMVNGDVDALWFGCSASTRRAIRKSESSGVRVESLDDDRLLAEFMHLHVDLRKRKYGLLAQPREFFESICRRFGERNQWFPLVACVDNRVIAVTIYLRKGDTLYYKFNASRPETLALRPNDALLWAGVRLAAQLGCRQLDLGRSDDDQPGLIRFKRQFGAFEHEIRSVRYVPPGYVDEVGPRVQRLLGRFTKLLTDSSVPDDVTERAGAALYRFFA